MIVPAESLTELASVVRWAVDENLRGGKWTPLDLRLASECPPAGDGARSGVMVNPSYAVAVVCVPLKA